MRTIFENYNFNVIDLGKDVPAEKIVEAVKNGDRIKAIIRIVRVRERENGIYEYGAQLLGLSYADKLKIGIFQMVND